MIVQVSVVMKRIVVVDNDCFDNLSGSHLPSHVTLQRQASMEGKYSGQAVSHCAPSGYKSDWSGH